MNYIPKSELVHGEYYDGLCRNASLARWDAQNNVFWHWRHKLGDNFTESIHHPDDEDQYDVFYPIKRVTPSTTIPMEITTL